MHHIITSFTHSLTLRQQLLPSSEVLRDDISYDFNLPSLSLAIPRWVGDMKSLASTGTPRDALAPYPRSRSVNWGLRKQRSAPRPMSPAACDRHYVTRESYVRYDCRCLSGVRCQLASLSWRTRRTRRGTAPTSWRRTRASCRLKSAT